MTSRGVFHSVVLCYRRPEDFEAKIAILAGPGRLCPAGVGVDTLYLVVVILRRPVLFMYFARDFM